MKARVLLMSAGARIAGALIIVALLWCGFFLVTMGPG